MKTFEAGEVAPIDEMLERTHYVQAKNAEIARLLVEVAERDNLIEQQKTCLAYLENAISRHGEVIEEANRYKLGQDLALGWVDQLRDERNDLAAKLAAAQAELLDLRIRTAFPVSPHETGISPHETKNAR